MLDTTNTGRIAEFLASLPPATLTRYWTIDVCEGDLPRIRFEWTIGDTTHIGIAELDPREGYRILDGELADRYVKDLGQDIYERLAYCGPQSGLVGHESGEEARAAFERHYDEEIGPDPVLETIGGGR